MRLMRRIFVAPAIARSSAARAIGDAPWSISLIARMRSEASPKAWRKAAMAASGFFRVNAEPM